MCTMSALAIHTRVWVTKLTIDQSDGTFKQHWVLLLIYCDDRKITSVDETDVPLGQ